MKIIIDIHEIGEGVKQDITIDPKGLAAANEFELKSAVIMLAGIDIMDDNLHKGKQVPGLDKYLFDNFALMFTKYLQAGGDHEIAKTLCPEDFTEDQKTKAVNFLSAFI